MTKYQVVGVGPDYEGPAIKISGSPRPSSAQDSSENGIAVPFKDAIVDPDEERLWKDALRNLNAQIVLYKDASKAGDAKGKKEAEEKIFKAMNNVADSHSDPNVRAHWKNKAKDFASADEDGKDDILETLLDAVIQLLKAPFILAGTILISLGRIVTGIGKLLTGEWGSRKSI